MTLDTQCDILSCAGLNKRFMVMITSNTCIVLTALKKKTSKQMCRVGEGGEVVTSSLQQEAMWCYGKYGLYLRTASAKSFNSVG